MWGIYYNELFDSLIASKTKVTNLAVEAHEGVTLFKDKTSQEIVGFNLFNIDDTLILHQAFNSFNPQVINFLKNKLTGIVDFEQVSQFVVGYVEACEPIPNTHLHKTQVKINDQKSLTIVCGAPNIAQGQYVVVALVGAWLPNGNQILPGKLYGIDSEGMICSAAELGLTDHQFNTTGIIELPKPYHDKVGSDFFENLKL